MKLSISLLVALLLPLAVYAQNEERFMGEAKASELIVVAEVVERLWSPGAWSGYIAFAQNVKYRISGKIKGESTGKEIIAGHYLVYGNYMADKETAQLSPELFKVGNKLILLLNKEDASCRSTSITPGKMPLYCAEAVHPFSDSLVERLKGIIKE